MLLAVRGLWLLAMSAFLAYAHNGERPLPLRVVRVEALPPCPTVVEALRLALPTPPRSPRSPPSPPLPSPPCAVPVAGAAASTPAVVQRAGADQSVLTVMMRAASLVRLDEAAQARPEPAGTGAADGFTRCAGKVAKAVTAINGELAAAADNGTAPPDAGGVPGELSCCITRTCLLTLATSHPSYYATLTHERDAFKAAFEDLGAAADDDRAAAAEPRRKFGGKETIMGDNTSSPSG